MNRTLTLRSPEIVSGLKALVDANWQVMAEAGKPMVCTVSEYKAKRSFEQNSRYWAILTEIAEGAWVKGRQYTPEVWAEYFKRKFIGVEELPDGREVGLSTTKLSVAEFSDFMTRIEQHAVSALGVELAA